MILTTTGTAATVTIAGLRDQSNNDLQLVHPQTVNLLDNYDSEDIQGVAASIQSAIDAGELTAQTEDGEPILDIQEATSGVSNLHPVAFSGEYSDLDNSPTIPGPAPVDSVNGQTGVIVLDKDDVGLDQVDNTSDVNKPISTATQLGLDSKEDSLGNPLVDGHILSSTIAGVRTWIAPPSSSGPGTTETYAYFPIWAEENSGLGNNAYEWAFGNGANSPAGTGLPLGVTAELYAITLSSSTTATNTVVSVEKDDVNVAQTDPLTGTSNVTILPSPVSFTVGERINFRTITGGGAGSPGHVTAWFRVLAKPTISHVFLTSTSTAPVALPAVNQPLNPSAQQVTIYSPDGSIVNNGNGTFTLSGGSEGGAYKVIGCIRGANYTSGADFYGCRIKDASLTNYGNQSIVYSNAATNLFSAQPFCSGTVTVPANTTVTIGIYLDFVSGTPAEFSPNRSFLSIERLR